MKELFKCYIITSYIEGDVAHLISPKPEDYIICADGGYDYAIAGGIRPDLIIGDLDSCTSQDFGSTQIVRFPAAKDQTDTFLCVQAAISKGLSDITIVGGIGGRLDHTVSNLQILSFFSKKTNKLTVIDEKNIITLLEGDSELQLPRKDGFKLSLLSISDECLGVSTKGLAYPLENARLTNDFPLGVSNEFSEDMARIKIKIGKLLIILSKD